jgi:hypothetical protein
MNKNSQGISTLILVLIAEFLVTSLASEIKCTCNAGYFQAVPCNTSHNVTCQECRECEFGEEYTVGVCTPDAFTDFQCANCTVCADNEYEAEACSSMRDTVCKACGSCVEGETYAAKVCGPESDHDVTCKDCSKCGEGQYVAQPCNLTHDTICRKESKSTEHSNWSCTECTPAQYAAAPCTDFSDTLCKPCTACGAGFFQAVPCRATSDTVCAAIPAQPEIRAAAEATVYRGFVLVNITLSSRAAQNLFVSFSQDAMELPSCNGLSTRSASASIILQATTTVQAVSCEMISETLIVSSLIVSHTFTVVPAPFVVVAISFTVDVSASAITPIMMESFAGAFAASLGLPSWRVQVIGVRDVPGRRLLAALQVEFRILTATDDDAAVVQQLVSNVDMTTVAAASGLNITVIGATTRVVAPPAPPSTSAAASLSQFETSTVAAPNSHGPIVHENMTSSGLETQPSSKPAVTSISVNTIAAIVSLVAAITIVSGMFLLGRRRHWCAASEAISNASQAGKDMKDLTRRRPSESRAAAILTRRSLENSGHERRRRSSSQSEGDMMFMTEAAGDAVLQPSKRALRSLATSTGTAAAYFFSPFVTYYRMSRPDISAWLAFDPKSDNAVDAAWVPQSGDGTLSRPTCLMTLPSGSEFAANAFERHYASMSYETGSGVRPPCAGSSTMVSRAAAGVSSELLQQTADEQQPQASQLDELFSLPFTESTWLSPPVDGPFNRPTSSMSFLSGSGEAADAPELHLESLSCDTISNESAHPADAAKILFDNNGSFWPAAGLDSFWLSTAAGVPRTETIWSLNDVNIQAQLQPDPLPAIEIGANVPQPEPWSSLHSEQPIVIDATIESGPASTTVHDSSGHELVAAVERTYGGASSVGTPSNEQEGSLDSAGAIVDTEFWAAVWPAEPTTGAQETQAGVKVDDTVGLAANTQSVENVEAVQWLGRYTVASNHINIQTHLQPDPLAAMEIGTVYYERSDYAMNSAAANVPQPEPWSLHSEQPIVIDMTIESGPASIAVQDSSGDELVAAVERTCGGASRVGTPSNEQEGSLDSAGAVVDTEFWAAVWPAEPTTGAQETQAGVKVDDTVGLAAHVEDMQSVGDMEPGQRSGSDCWSPSLLPHVSGSVAETPEAEKVADYAAASDSEQVQNVTSGSTGPVPLLAAVSLQPQVMLTLEVDSGRCRGCTVKLRLSEPGSGMATPTGSEPQLWASSFFSEQPTVIDMDGTGNTGPGSWSASSARRESPAPGSAKALGADATLWAGSACALFADPPAVQVAAAEGRPEGSDVPSAAEPAAAAAGQWRLFLI